MLDTLYVRDFGKKTRFLARLPNYPAAQAAMPMVKYCATDKELATFFGIKTPRWSNWRRSCLIHREFEIALAMRYGFSPTPGFVEEHRTMPLREIYSAWFAEHWTSWRNGDAEAFEAEILAKVDIPDGMRPLPATDPDLLEAIADIPKQEEGSAAAAARIGPATPPSLAAQPINQLIELVSMSAGYPGGNNPEDGHILLVAVNANVEKLKDGDRTYLYQLNSARLDLRAKGTMPRPIGWAESGPRAQAVGTDGWTVRILSAPPADVVWRIDRTEPGFSQAAFRWENFGTLVGEIDATDALLLKVREADLDVEVEDPQHREVIAKMPNNKRKVWKNVIVRAALEAEEGSEPYRTLCLQPLGRLA